MLQEEQLPAIRARSGFGWIYFNILRIARQFASETFTQKVKKQQQQQYKQFKFIVVSALFPARLIRINSFRNHTSCVESIVFLSTKQKN